MHILLIHQAFASLKEPGGTRHHEFARLLAKDGNRVSIIASPVSYLTGTSSKKSYTIEHDMGGMITIYRSYTYSALHKSFFHRLLSFFSFMVSSFFGAMKVKNVDLVWGTTPPIFQSVTAWLVARLKRVPFLLEVRDLWPAFAIAVGVLKNPILIKMSLWLERFLYKHADQIVVNSPGFIEHVSSKGGKNLVLIPNGADEAFFQLEGKLNAKIKTQWVDKFVVLYAGAHGMSNDLGTVLESAKILENQKDIQFIFLGDGKEKSILISKSKELNLTNIQFLDPVPKAEIAGYLQASNACLAILKPIDLYKTTYPNKVFDYMAAGKPVILAIDGVIRDVIEAADCGYFCEPGNPVSISEAVLRLYTLNAEEQKKLGDNGRKYLVENFDRTSIGKEFSDMIEQMVKKNR